MQTPLRTERLRLRRFVLEDAEFVLELVNEPGWLRFIGDKDVHSIADARRYLQTGPMDMYSRFGFGLYRVALADDTPVGMCGLIKRDVLDAVDIGFAFLARHTGQGYAFEAARAVLQHAQSHGLERLLAITTPDNIASQSLLRKLGMHFERELQMTENASQLHVFAMNIAEDVT